MARAQKETTLDLCDLPDELLGTILDCLSATDLVRSRLVSKRFNELAANDYIWLKRLNREFGVSSSIQGERSAMQEYAEYSSVRFDRADSGLQLSDDLRTATGAGPHDKAVLNRRLVPGQSRFACDVHVVKAGWSFVGIGPRHVLTSSSVCLSNDTYSYGFDGHIYEACSAKYHRPADDIAFVSGCVIGMAVDLRGAVGHVYFYRNGENVSTTVIREQHMSLDQVLYPVIEARNAVVKVQPAQSFRPPWGSDPTPLWVKS